MRTIPLASAFPLSLALFLVACGGAQPAPATPPPAASGEAASPAASGATPEPVAAPATWSADLSKEQKAAFMKKYVAPNMAKVFQSADATKYPKFGCKTCHGPDFKLPKDFLPKLVFKDGKLQTDKPEVAKFMGEKVVPEMASTLGMKPFDMKTHQGFGCGGCHTVEMGK